MATRIVVDPVTAHRGALAHRSGSERREDRGRLQRRHDGARLREDPCRARSARRLGFCRAGLRGLHDRACAGLRPHGRERAGHHGAAERRDGAQPDVLRPVHAGSRRSLLPSARPGLGRRCERVEGRSCEDLGDCPQHLQVAEDFAQVLWRRSGPLGAVCRKRPTGHLRQRLLGPQGLQVAAGSKPAGCSPLYRGPGVAEGDRQDPYDFRRQEPAPQLSRGRNALR